jgi:hypothetical protein
MAHVYARPHFLKQKEFLVETPSSGFKIASSLGLLKVADNRYLCPSTKDLWKVEGDKLVRLSATAVDNGENLEPADVEKPETFLAGLLDDLEF